jgi:hypothetical protein
MNVKGRKGYEIKVCKYKAVSNLIRIRFGYKSVYNLFVTIYYVEVYKIIHIAYVLFKDVIDSLNRSCDKNTRG